MKKSEHKRVEQYLRQLGDLLELRDWKLVLDDDEPDSDAEAHVHICYGRKWAHIKVASDIVADRVKLRHSLVHELIHCHVEPSASMVRSDLEEYLGKQTDQIFWNGYKRQVEYAVDALSTALARHLPLMPK